MFPATIGLIVFVFFFSECLDRSLPAFRLVISTSLYGVVNAVHHLLRASLSVDSELDVLFKP